MAELREAANAITIMNVPPTTLDDMPPSVLAIIASHVMGVSVKKIEEVRVCTCLDDVAKIFPFRVGKTTNMFDQTSQTDIRRDLGKCAFDHPDFDSWCRDPDFATIPGRSKHLIPNFAAASKKLWRKWRDATAYVFCCEQCLENAVMYLPPDNKRMMTRIRFFELNNKYNIEGPSIESYWNGPTDQGSTLTYETYGNKLVKYRGKKVWVKELVLRSNGV